MPTYIKTCSFATQRGFKSDKDDAEVNSALERLQSHGATILDVKIRLAGTEMSVHATYLIVYEASSPL